MTKKSKAEQEINRFDVAFSWALISVPLMIFAFFAILFSEGINSSSISGLNPLIGFPLVIFVAFQITGQFHYDTIKNSIKKKNKNGCG